MAARDTFMRHCAESAEQPASRGHAPRQVLRLHWHLVGVVALGVVSTGGVWGLFTHREDQLLQAEFAARARERVAAISREMRDDVDLLYAAGAYFAGSGSVGRGEFETFVSSLASRAQSVLAIEWAPRIDRNQRENFERRLREGSTSAGGIRELGRGNALAPAGIRDFYFPVEYSFGSGNVGTEMLGFDHACEPKRWQAMRRAIDAAQPIASERLTIVREAVGSDRHGVLVALPVFARGAVPETPAERRENLTGFILGVYRLSDVVRRALADLSDTGINCHVLDATGPGQRDHLHFAGTLDQDAPGVSANPDPRLVYSAPIEVPGRKWVIECWPTRQFVAAHSSILPRATLIIGMLGTGLVTALLWLVDGRADAVERIVIDRTAALRSANEELEAEVRERVAAESKLAEHARNLEESNRQLEQARADLQRQATVDPLTGVLNRLSFAERFASEWSRTCRLKLPLSCILLDIDFFKKINDTHGHPVGDEVLKTLARLLREHTRDYDCVARFGGEEFCILLPSTQEVDAIEWAERLRKLIAATQLHDGDTVFHMTASFGVSSRTGDLKGPEELLNQSDEALLIAKRQGRNRVIAFSDLHRLATAALDSGSNVFRGACAADIMTPVLVHLAPTQSLQEAAGLLLALRLDSVPVIDEDGRTLGIIGEEDLTAQILSDQGWRQVVGDVMNTTPVTYDAQIPAADICEFLSRVTVRRVIILHCGRPVGLISRSTLIRWLRNALLSGPEETTAVEDAATEVVAERLRTTIDRLTSQIAALQEGVRSPGGVVTPIVVSAATRIQELVDDALMLSADQDSGSVGGYATMGAVLS